MNTTELKIDLIHQITTINDKAKLKEILQLMKFQSDESVYVTTHAEKNAIREARNQIKQGEIISNEVVQKEIKEWLEQ